MDIMDGEGRIGKTMNLSSVCDPIPEDYHDLENATIQQNGISVGNTEGRKIRLVLYSHDTMGLGHIRRNLLIAQALQASFLSLDILLITGAKEAGQFVLPEDADRLILPLLYKNGEGGYRSRHLSLELDDIIDLRSQIIMSAVRSFNPDIMLVDNVARGACGELDRTLEYLNKSNETRLVLGMRDIKDEPLKVEKEWDREGFEDIVEKYYDEIWVYGDRNVYDITTAYSLKPDIASKVQFTGYFDQRMRIVFAKEQGLATHQLISYLQQTPYVLCMVGGGQDGLQLAEAFLQIQLEEGLHGVLLTGPYMAKEACCRLYELAQASNQMQVMDFFSEPTLLLKDAQAVVSMGGYNSVSEILSFSKRALIVPRIKPRQEQLIRAEQLFKRGILDFILPHQLNPHTLETWIAEAVKLDKIHRDTSIDMNGLTRIPDLLKSLLSREDMYQNSSLAGKVAGK